MEQLTYERLQDNLKRLKLFKAVEILDSVADTSEANGGSYFAFLDQLLEEEVAAKDKRRVSTAIKIAGLPMAKTIEEYDFSFHPHLDKKLNERYHPNRPGWYTFQLPKLVHFYTAIDRCAGCTPPAAFP